MSHLTETMHKIRALARLYEEAPYENFRNDEKGRQKNNPSAPMYLMRALGQLEYAYRLHKAGDVAAEAVQPAAEIALNALNTYGVLPPEEAKRVEEALLPLQETAKQ